MKNALFALLSLLIILFALLVTSKKDNLRERLKEIESSYPEPLVKAGGVPSKKRRKSDLSFLHIPRSVSAAVSDSGLPLRVEEYVMLWISAALLPALLVFILTADYLRSIPLVLIGAAVPPFVLKAKKKKRLKSFATQLGDALMLIANGLRAGFSFEQVLENVAKDMPDPIAGEFSRVGRELKMGMSMENSLTALTERMDNTDMRLLTSAILIQRQVGGNLAEILDTISVTIQDRIKIKNHVSSLTAQGKISGIVVGLVPVFLYVAISVVNPEYMEVFNETTYGHVLLAVAIGMEAAGFLIIRKMSDLLG